MWLVYLLALVVGGGLLFVPAEVVQPTELNVDGLMSIYVSMGVTAAQYLPTTGGEDTVA